MRLSSMADYAVVTMSAAARHCGGQRGSAADLARETGLPGPTVQDAATILAAGADRYRRINELMAGVLGFLTRPRPAPGR